MKTSSAKAKGRRCATEIKELIHKYYPALHDSDVSVTSSGVTGPDLKFSLAALEALKYIIVEAKNCERLNIWQALAQSESHKGALDIGEPVLFFKRNRSKVYAAVDAEYFLKLLA